MEKELDKKLKVIPKPKDNTRAVLELKPDPDKPSTVLKEMGV